MAAKDGEDSLRAKGDKNSRVKRMLHDIRNINSGIIFLLVSISILIAQIYFQSYDKICNFHLFIFAKYDNINLSYLIINLNERRIVPSVSAADHSSILIAAVNWVERLLIGTLGTSIAVLAIAGVGFAMLQGYLPVRNGVRVLIGCFILFGAPLIAQGFARALRGEQNVAPRPAAPMPNIPTAQQEPTKANPFDPYAGATVPH